MIKYVQINDFIYQVILDGQVIGKINRKNEGWQYTPTGSKISGGYFPTLRSCKQSLGC